MHVLYVYVSICRYFQRHMFRYMQILTYTNNTYKYVHTYRICTVCKCTFLFVFFNQYETMPVSVSLNLLLPPASRGVHVARLAPL